MDLKQNFAMNVRQEALRWDLNQAQIAERLDITPKMISFWIAGKAMPRWDSFIRLCSLFQVEPWELLADPEYRTELKRTARRIAHEQRLTS